MPDSLKAARPVSLQRTAQPPWLSFAGWSPEYLGQAGPWPAPLTLHLFLSSVSQALQCYSFQHIYYGPFDLSNMKFLNISCPQGCSESVLSLDTGEGQDVAKREGSAEEKGRGNKEETGTRMRHGRRGRGGAEGVGRRGEG